MDVKSLICQGGDVQIGGRAWQANVSTSAVALKRRCGCLTITRGGNAGLSLTGSVPNFL